MIDIVTQYRTIAAAAGWIDRPARGRLRFDGADRASFLQALLSNEVEDLGPGAGAYALYLTPQGRMIADLHVFVRPDSLVADVPADQAAGLAEAFDRLVFAEDVLVTDVSSALRQISVVGAGAARILSRAFDTNEEALGGLDLWAQIDVPAGFVVRTDDAAEGSWDLVIEAGSADAPIAALAAAGATPMTAELFDALRVDAGRPLFGVDMTSETIPLEAGLLERAISQTKGCYVGQEVIIRVLHRGGGRVAKRLVQLSSDAADPLPVAGAVISHEGREVGRVTSAAISPRTGLAVSLGYVHRDAAEVGVKVALTWPDQESAASAFVAAIV